MKKNIFFLLGLVLFVFNVSIAQEDSKVEFFEVTENNPYLINQFVVIEKDSMSIEKGYMLVNQWINVVYNTPKEVIKSKIENEYIRIEGVKSNSPCIKAMGILSCYDSKYSITFAFKENKIKFQVTRLQLYSPPSQYNSGGWTDVSPSYALLFKKNGKPYKMQVSITEGISSDLNDLKDNLKEYINKPIKKETSASDW